ncbi:MAG TPA: FAD-dependent thymidylate synthase [bacterium]|nr:FAD-dependent thymidylate synthase [bacterium]
MDLFAENVLDHGFVRLVDFMGGDLAVVQAARVSVGKDITTPDRDRKLVHFLLENRHETPFEHSLFKFHIKCPIFVARQWFRHRISSYNEISGRYTEMKEEFYLPQTLRAQKNKNYVYTALEEKMNEELLRQVENSYQQAFQLYQTLLQQGVAKEHARIVLPLALYTEFYWSVNARSLMNFLMLRSDPHAQWEIQQYAQSLERVFAAQMPWTHEIFCKMKSQV